jgi:GNAT superfamily N-acetyltransferase
MLTIEPATSDDLEPMADLLVLLFTQEVDFTPQRDNQLRGLRAILDSPTLGQIFVARMDGEVIGLASLMFTISTASGGPACWLEDFIVTPEHRGSGIGQALVRHAIDYARSHGHVRVALITDKTNDRAQRLYERLGFQRSDMVIMRQSLLDG